MKNDLRLQFWQSVSERIADMSALHWKVFVRKGFVHQNGQQLDVSILLLLTNRYNKGILLHFSQQNGKKNRKIKDFDKTIWKWPEKHFGTKKIFWCLGQNDPLGLSLKMDPMVHFQAKSQKNSGLGTKIFFVPKLILMHFKQVLKISFC